MSANRSLALCVLPKLALCARPCSSVHTLTVPADVLAKEKEILTAQAMNEGKPQAVAEKMVMGRIKKFYSENCLLDQEYVQGDKISVAQHVANVAKELGGEIKLTKFVRFEKGDGLEKREDNFAEEVASMMK